MGKDNKQWLKVIEIANLIGLSKVTIYKKLKTIDNKVLMPLGKIEQGTQYYDIKILDLLQPEQLYSNLDSDNTNTTNSANNNINNHNNTNNGNSLNDYIAMDTEDISLSKEIITMLTDQLKVKDLQLSEKDNQLGEKDVQLKQKDIQLDHKDIQIDKLHSLIENSQVLLKEKPQQDVLQLEEHFQALDNKLIEIKDKMQKKDQEHKGIFKKIFKK